VDKGVLYYEPCPRLVSVTLARALAHRQSKRALGFRAVIRLIRDLAPLGAAGDDERDLKLLAVLLLRGRRPQRRRVHFARWYWRAGGTVVGRADEGFSLVAVGKGT
jgi:hypothetical protein